MLEIYYNILGKETITIKTKVTTVIKNVKDIIYAQRGKFMTIMWSMWHQRNNKVWQNEIDTTHSFVIAL